MPSESLESDHILPRFRNDLKIYKGPFEIDGSPTFNIYDPVKGQFYKIAWKESLIFRSYQEETTAAKLAEKISVDFPVKVTTEDVTHFFLQAFALGLLRVPQDAQKLYNIHTGSKGSWFNWFIQHYLFVRIPLFHPDAFLTKTLHYFKFLGSRLALFLYAIIIFTGFFLLFNRSDQFFNTFSYFFNLQGIFLYASMVTAVKCIHELSHAYVAKKYGLYVPTMGIAFLVLWPVLYTDVTEGWKLDSRKERFFISFAGIASELVMAGVATIAWAMTSPGLIQSLCFVLASTSWFSTLVININPAIRFDGYYILSDLWGIDNLMTRAFAFTRWKMHQTLFGIEQQCPEENISTRRAAGFIFFTIYTIIYRFFLYTAIALFVYYEFTKILGIFLFLAEIWIFFIMPVVWEIKELYRLRSFITYNFRTWLTIAIFSLFSFWFFIPLPHQITLPAVIVPQNKQIIYAPENAKITKILAENGKEVTVGTPLIQLESESLQLEISHINQNKEILENELLYYSNHPESENLISHKKAELAQIEKIRLSLLKRQDHLTILSDNNGKVMNWNPRLIPGQSVQEGEIFGSIADIANLMVVAFAKETDISDLKIGQKGEIVFQNSTINFIKTEILKIDNKRVTELIYPSLASIYGGSLAVVPHKSKINEGALLLHDSYYQVTFSLKAPQAHLYLGQSVSVKIQGPWRSYFVELVKFAYREVFKESSF